MFSTLLANTEANTEGNEIDDKFLANQHYIDCIVDHPQEFHRQAELSNCPQWCVSPTTWTVYIVNLSEIVSQDLWWSVFSRNVLQCFTRRLQFMTIWRHSDDSGWVVSPTPHSLHRFQMDLWFVFKWISDHGFRFPSNHQPGRGEGGMGAESVRWRDAVSWLVRVLMQCFNLSSGRERGGLL